MKKVAVFVSLLALAVVVAIPAGAQTNSKNIARIITLKAKPGEGQQFEAGVKKLNAWEHQQNLPGTSYVWSVISGQGFGDYIVGTFGHDWKDFDEMQARGEKVGVGKEIGETVAPYTASVGISYYAYLNDLNSPITPGQPPMPMSEVTFFTLKPGGMQAVVTAIKQANTAIAKAHWTGNGSGAGWYALADGGEGPQIVLSIGLKNWAAMRRPSMSLHDVLVQEYGKPGAQAILQSFDAHVRSEYNEIIRYHPDLSYNAPAK